MAVSWELLPGVEVTQIDRGWGAGPSVGYDLLAEQFRPVFEQIRETAVSRDLARKLPYTKSKS